MRSRREPIPPRTVEERSPLLPFGVPIPELAENQGEPLLHSLSKGALGVDLVNKNLEYRLDRESRRPWRKTALDRADLGPPQEGPDGGH